MIFLIYPSENVFELELNMVVSENEVYYQIELW